MASSPRDYASLRGGQSTAVMVFRNEFSTVELQRDESANSPRLCVRDVATGRTIYLDPIQLEALTRMTPEDFATLLDPS